MSRPGSHAQRRRGRRSPFLLVLVLAVALAGGLVWFFELRPGAADEAAAGPECLQDSVQVAVAPAVAEVVGTALDDMSTDCLTYEVAERSSGEIAQEVSFGGDLPPMWVPDGDWAVQRLQSRGTDLTVVSDALATTPVVLVAGDGAQRPDTWADAMASAELAMPDPADSTVGALALLAPRAEARATGGSVQETATYVVPTAQRYGALAATGKEVDLDLASLGTDGRTVVTTEAELATDQTGAQEVTPETGAMLQRYPLVVRGNASQRVKDAADELGAWFRSPDGGATLAEAHLRGPDSSPLDGEGVGDVSLLPAPEADALDASLATWQVLSAPSSVLAVFDVSGSMDFDAPEGGTRIELSTGVARTALDIFPDHARIGMWAFSIDQGVDGADYRVLEPIRRLDARKGGVTQRNLLRRRAGQLAGLTDGGTGLYDTALAAYRQAVQDYDPNYANAVILITDGANDDPGSISLKTLVTRLERARDEERPVRIVAIGLTGDADMQALQRIARATEGRAHRADTPEDILRVFSSEIASR